MRRHERNIGLVIVAMMLVAGLQQACAARSGRTPEGVTADYGLKIAQTVRDAQEAIGTIGKASTVPQVRTGAVAALKGLDKVNALGVQLADKLDAIRKARAAGANIDPSTWKGAVDLIDGIDAAIALDVIPKLGDSPEVRAGLEAARAVSKLALEISLQLGSLKTGA